MTEAEYIDIDDAARFRRAMRWATLCSLIILLFLLWGIPVDPFRSGQALGGFSNFFDLQAESFLRGELRIEPGELGIEAFVARGNEYTYFPPGPALLRLPIIAVARDASGDLTAPSMLLAWFVITMMLTRLMWLVRTMFATDAGLATEADTEAPAARPLGRFELIMWALLHVAVCGGSVVVFLASMPWVYHEVYMWAIAIVLGGSVAIIRLCQTPTTRLALILGGWVLAAVLVRATAGWALGAAAIGLAAWLWRGGWGDEGRRVARTVLLAGAIPLVIGVAINWAKFRHPYLFPIEDQLYTSVSPQRQRAIAANGGDLVSLEVVPTTLINYFRPDGIHFGRVFPFIGFPERPAPTFGSATIDQSYRTGGATAFMPLLCVLGVWGLVTMVRTSTRQLTRSLRLPLAITIIIGGPVAMWAYMAYRYVAEFAPLLILGSVIGLAQLLGRSPSWSVNRKRALVGVTAAITMFSVAANTAAGHSLSATNNPGDRLDTYVRNQIRLSDRMGHPVDDRISVIDALPLPETSRPDTYLVVGECDAAYAGTGDDYFPWEALSLRERVITITLDDDVSQAEFDLGTVGDGDFTSTFSIEIDGDRFRTHVVGPRKPLDSDWNDFDRAEPIVLDLLVSIEFRVYSLEPAPEDDKVAAPHVDYIDDRNTQSLFEPAPSPGGGIAVDMQIGPPSELCNLLLERAEQ